MSRTRVVLADDHAVLRESLRVLVNAQADLEVVGEAGTGPEAVEQVRQAEPHVLCLDLSMPGWGAAATIERVRAAAPGTRVLVLTMHDDPAYVRAAVAAGAAGYMLKSTPLATVLDAIRSVAAGQRVIDAPLQAVAAPPPAAGPAEALLSRREREILELLARGHTHQEIADKLFVSVKTIETYRARVREKTGLKTRADFVRYGSDRGLLGPPPSTPE